MTDAIRAETVFIPSGDGTEVEAYFARPLDAAPRGGVVVIHHLPGYDAWTKEVVRKFAVDGYNAICVNLFHRQAPGASSDDASAFVRANGGVSDDQVVTDVEGAVAYLRSLDNANGKVGVIGYCSGGRHVFLVATTIQVDAAVDCYGAFVVEDPPDSMKWMRPLLQRTPQLSSPLLGLFGVEDQNPSPAETSILAAELDKYGKQYDFHTYDGAGHGFFSNDRPAYRVDAVVDGWRRIREFYGKHLAG
jgi:carboxymethylenebutenolidase